MSRFRITAALGAGGMGEVYRATDTSLGREVAVKLLPAAFAENPDRVARLQREARLLASLNHAHIAHLYGLETATVDGTTIHVLVMELVERRRRKPPTRVVDSAARYAGSPRAGGDRRRGESLLVSR